MNLKNCAIAGVGAAWVVACNLTGPAFSQTVTTNGEVDPTAELRRQIDQLQSQVDQLLQGSGEAWLTEQRSAEIRALVMDVLADADTRANLLDAGMTSGYDGGFMIADAGGSWKLRINAYEQFRFIWNHQDDSPADNDRHGFENARTRLILSGNIVDSTWVYKIEGDFSRDGGAFGLQDAYIGHAFQGGWTVLAGQFKVPMLREELVADTMQLAVERSLVNQEFTAGRTQGVAIDWRGDRFHFVGGATDGHPATGGFNTPWSGYDTEYSLTGRAEWLAAGSWGQFDDFTSWRGESFAAMLGGAIHYQAGESGTAADELDVLQWTFDGSLEFGGANLHAYVVGRHLDTSSSSSDQYAFVIQGGYFFTDDVEAYARYEWGDDDSGEHLSVVTVGANKYFHRHNLKWTTDVGFALNEVDSVWGDGSIGDGGDVAGWRTDSADGDGQIVFRTQMQLMF